MCLLVEILSKIINIYISSLVIRRCFAALGFDEYWESHGDGLQILRYNLTTAYNTHMDTFEDLVSTVNRSYGK